MRKSQKFILLATGVVALLWGAGVRAAADQTAAAATPSNTRSLQAHIVHISSGDGDGTKARASTRRIQAHIVHVTGSEPGARRAARRSSGFLVAHVVHVLGSGSEASASSPAKPATPVEPTVQSTPSGARARHKTDRE